MMGGGSVDSLSLSLACPLALAHLRVGVGVSLCEGGCVGTTGDALGRGGRLSGSGHAYLQASMTGRGCQGNMLSVRCVGPVPPVARDHTSHRLIASLASCVHRQTKRQIHP